MNNRKIFVTQPSLPPLAEFIPYLEQIWESKTLTNNGPYHQQLEKALCEYLGVPHIALFCNGTIALMTALKALRIQGEVITTPYSFVCTSHSLLWNDLQPVFVDVDPFTLNLDPRRIEEAITPQTSAILPVHCYGLPADTEEIQRIADVYGLKVIYDAAHAFGVKKNGESILNAGDLSVLSLHATKVFNTFEGGAIVCKDEKTKQRIDYLKNFGFANEVTVMAPGINGKMSELNAAMGLLQLKYVDTAIEKRRRIQALYRELLSNIPGIKTMALPEDVEWNASYMPVFVNNHFPISRDALYNRLKEHDVHGRRYFYPLISNMPMYRKDPSASPRKLPNAHKAADQVLCLPIYPDLLLEDVARICVIIDEAAHG
jgi:dTDP-4-amino-4,6-dideoxygalactose transaminase